MGRRLKLPAGSLLSIPSGPNRFAVGQVLIAGMVFYLGIDPEERESFGVNSPFAPKLFAWTTDGDVYRGVWKVIGSRPVVVSYPRPDYKVARAGEMVVISFDGETIRPFDPDRDQNLCYRSSQSSPLIGDAVAALNGHGEWLPLYDKLVAR